MYHHCYSKKVCYTIISGSAHGVRSQPHRNSDGQVQQALGTLYPQQTTIYYTQHVHKPSNLPLSSLIHLVVRADILGEKIHIPIALTKNVY